MNTSDPVTLDRPLATVDQMRERIKRQSKLKGRQVQPDALAQVQALLGDRPATGYRRDLLIEYLHILNDHFGGLHEQTIAALAKAMQIPQSEVFEVATFYHHFEVLKGDAQAAGITVRVCSGLSCEMAGAQDLLQRLPALLGNPDVRVIAAPCVGRCEQAPVAVVHQMPVPSATLEKVQACVAQNARNHPTADAGGSFGLLQAVQTGQPSDLCTPSAATTVAPGYVGLQAYLAGGGYQLAQRLTNNPEAVESVIKTLEDAGLRGLGGAGFPAGRKWRIVRDQPAPKLMAVNIDEGEPGTFKDRTYLERDPHRFLEGVVVAAQAVGIAKVYIYLRDEYHGCRDLLQQAIDQLQTEAPVALKALLPSIELRRGAGAYICGEESAMIESIEGKRGEPRMRPPYIAQVGLFGRPTLEHNFETLYWVRDLVEQGANWFTSFGRNGRKGLRSYSLSGRVKSPGVKLAPAGISVVELINEYGGGMLDGHTLYAYLPGGASGGILPASLGHVPLDFDTLQPYGSFIGSAAVIVLSQHDSAKAAARNMMQFFADESCGQCTPCRVGTQKALALMQQDTWDAATLNDLSTVMIDASICGLGQAAPNPLLSVLKYFPAEVGVA
jgi:NADH:ubiquinone oxidoreductase subunit F (NADH-binding)/NADH:ubiquinone oxidoreductase subunit E